MTELKRTESQQSAADNHFQWLQAESCRAWDKLLLENPSLAKLQMAIALLARYDTERDQGSLILAEQRAWLKGRIGQLVSECSGPALKEHSIRCMILRLFGDGGLRRLEARAV